LIRSSPVPFICGIHKSEMNEAIPHLNEKLFIIDVEEGSV